MKPDEWMKLKAVLQEAIELAEPRREAYLRRSGLPEELLGEARSLLAFEEDSRCFMTARAGELAVDFFGRPKRRDAAALPERIGIYEIVEEIGTGGMGAVYLGRRGDGKFEQKVAIKMLRRELDGEIFRRRFRLEKEIQAKLEHPAIARLLDAGSTADGLPFLVMEYIEGTPIDRYCEEKSLPLKARLILFNKACEAVAFAHRNLIVHCDLKPSNILVNEDGEPKLLDFGIAKLLGGAEDQPRAESGFGAMTPGYASPEQIRGEPVTTAGDVYSLGVILFNILTGTHPFGKTNRSLENFLADGRRLDPPPASRTLAAREAEIAVFAASGFAPRRLPYSSRRLKGDLDDIVAKAMQPAPARRYHTVERLVEDVWRHLDCLPVSARPNTPVYRASRFYRRHRVEAFAALLVFFAVMAGLAGSVWQAAEARAQTRLAEQARQRAEIEAAKALAEGEKSRKIGDFMSKVISYANPAWYAPGARTGGRATVIDVLDDLSGKIDVEFANQPDVQAELHHKFAEVYHIVAKPPASGERRLFYIARNEFHARRALELRREFYGPEHELVAKDLFYFCTTLPKGDSRHAPLLAEAIRMMRGTNPHNLNLPYMIEAYTTFLIDPRYEAEHETFRRAALPATGEDKFSLAERLLRESLGQFRAHYREDNPATFNNECRLAYVLAKQGKAAEAEPFRQKCRLATERTESEKSKETFKVYLTGADRALAAR